MTRTAVLRSGIIAAIAGGAGWVVGLIVDPHAAWTAYLVAVFSVLTVSLGALALVLTAHLTDATWFVVIRRIAESVAGATPVLVILLVPLAFGLHSLYPWLAPERLDPHARELVVRKLAYLNLPFFLIRAIVYVASWLAIVFLVRRWSARQDRGEQPAPLAGSAAAGAIVLGFTVTFASFDWLMSLRPDWASTIYGVRVFSGAFVGSLALMAVVMHVGRLPLGSANAHALASLLLAFVIFWGYIAFAQLLIIWIGNLPREISWYVARAHGWWLAVGIVLLLGHFAVPFLFLLFRAIKRNPRALAWLGCWLLAMHYLDVCWLVVPETGGGSFPELWIYLAALLLVSGAAAAMSAWWLRGLAAIPTRDPDLGDSLAYDYEHI